MPDSPRVNHPGIYVEGMPGGARSISGVPTSITAFLGRAASGPVDEPTSIDSYAEYERVYGGLSLDSAMGFAVRDYFANGGRQAIVVRLFHGPAPGKAVGAGEPLDRGDYVGLGMRASKRGLYALDKADLFNLLCIPPDGGEDIDRAVVERAAAYCEGWRAMLLVDPLSNLRNPTRTELQPYPSVWMALSCYDIHDRIAYSGSVSGE